MSDHPVSAKSAQRPNEAGGFLIGLACILIYSFLYYYIYRTEIFPTWEYLGFRMYAKDNVGLYAGIFLISASYFTMPRRVAKASDHLLWLLYALAFIPIEITLGISGTIQNVPVYQVSLFGSFSIAVLMVASMEERSWSAQRTVADTYAPTRTRGPKISHVLLIFSIVSVLLLAAQFHSIMSFAGMTEIYEQRDRVSNYGINALSGYLILWLTYAISPLLLLYGIFSKRIIYIFLSIVSVLIIYSITASKAALIILLFCLCIYFLRRTAFKRVPYIVIFLPAIPLILLYLFNTLSGGTGLPILRYLLDVVVVRGVAVQAKNFVLYAEFFSHNPLTYYSHVTGISWIIQNPYSVPLGQVISAYATGSYDGNSNAGIWSTDGLAAAGNVGIILVGIMLGIFLRFLNMLTKDVDYTFASVVVVPLVMLMVNVSMFTTLASGGGVLLMLMIRPLWQEIKADRELKIAKKIAVRDRVAKTKMR